MSKDSYSKICKYFGLHHVEQLITSWNKGLLIIGIVKQKSFCVKCCASLSFNFVCACILVGMFVILFFLFLFCPTM